VGFAGAVHVEITQADDRMAEARGVELGEVFHGELGIAINIERGGRLRLAVGGFAPAVGRGAAGPDDPGSPLHGQIQELAKPLDVVVHHLPLIHHGRVRNGGSVENQIKGEGRAERADVASDVERPDVAFEVDQVAKLAGGEIIENGNIMPIGEEPFGDIRSDKTGPTSNKSAHIHLDLKEKMTLIADRTACDQKGFRKGSGFRVQDAEQAADCDKMEFGSVVGPLRPFKSGRCRE
jgi:hypothetical protein